MHGRTLSEKMLTFARYLKSADDLITGPDITSLRAGTSALRRQTDRHTPPVWRIDQDRFEGIDYNIYRPQDRAAAKAAVFLHGGGFSHLDTEVYDPILRRFALEGDMVIIAPNYPLAPETPFPENIYRCERFLQHIQTKAKCLGIDPRLGLMGDSAGANLALGCALIQRDAGRTRLSRLGLIYGAFDLVTERESHRLFGSGDLPLTTQAIRASRDLYIPDPSARNAPLASPIFAKLSNLPPTFLCIASHDPLFDENIEMARRLGLGGVDVTARIYPGTIHGFLEADSVSGDASARLALTEIARFMAA
ncbi:alpha/beta hydrolase [Paracoccus sp. (in: a-proteobacteria)]|uniref:alpha/beta hydrolase n=1 Tax=Paracoccus sp. TaxID=267 RepID=UPI003A857ED4